MASRTNRNLGTKDLAHHLGMTQKQVRRRLRAMPEYDDASYTHYEWSPREFSKVSAKIKSSFRQEPAPSRARVTSKGQLVIPAGIRERYQITKGTEVRFEELEDGILLRPITDQSIDRVRGILEGMDLPDRIEKEPDREIE